MAESVNPASFEIIKKYQNHTGSEIDDIISRSDAAFKEWHKTSFGERKKLILQLSENLSSNTRSYAKIITDEMGKVYTEAIAEIKKCASSTEFFANNLEKFLSDIKVPSEFRNSFITFNPLGTILAVMPWNFPFWQLFRAAVPAIAAGNTVVMKHSSNVSGSALLIEDIFKDSGFPKDIFRTIIAPGSKVEGIIANRLIKGVTFTGSTEVGRKIARTAGEHLKKCVLELGGNDPYIVFGDADVNLAAEKCAASRLINAGQSCIAAKRFIINKSVYDKFTGKFVEIMENGKFGDPYDKNNKIGPLVSKQARDDIHDIVKDYGTNNAAKILSGGKIPVITGAYYPPTVLETIDEKKIRDIEIFGPVAIIQRAENDDECIRIANNSNFGLGAAIFSKNIQKAETIAARYIETGSVFINDLVKSDPRFPFGGTKDSGLGRELSEFGIREFTNIKTVIVT